MSWLSPDPTEKIVHWYAWKFKYIDVKNTPMLAVNAF